MDHQISAWRFFGHLPLLQATLPFRCGPHAVSSKDSNLVFELSISAKDEIESNRFGPRSYYYDRRYFYLDDDTETEERFILRLTIKDKAEDKSLWTGFTSWNQNRLNDSSDTETIQALVNSLLQEL